MRRFFAVAAVGFGALGVLGCPSASTMGLARTLDQGRIQGYVAPGAIGISNVAAGQGGIAPNIEGGIRYGITDTTEIGARLGLTGLALEGKFALMRSPTFDGGLDLSLAPSVSFVFASAGNGGSTSGGGIISLSVPVLFGINTGNGSQLVLGPKVADTIAFGGGQVGNVVWLGGSLGFAWKVAPGFRLLPEIAALAPVVGTAAGAGTGVGVSTFFYQAGIGLVFGGYNDS